MVVKATYPRSTQMEAGTGLRLRVRISTFKVNWFLQRVSLRGHRVGLCLLFQTIWRTSVVASRPSLHLLQKVWLDSLSVSLHSIHPVTFQMLRSMPFGKVIPTILEVKVERVCVRLGPHICVIDGTFLLRMMELSLRQGRNRGFCMQ